ncbi:KIR protein [Plasmodium knowlesi strain H]|uniref:KIR protein n=3 Tax=Plasmodium knowlesi TaxID=5850 RepID=A0A5K1UEE9_PLAKH|nr:KIR protein [Plasmodium knowlesi strain H]OTN64378.1 KIR protein [Plasmodium knowlesi]CAA9988955.1 KIR protein [Plasmodium knowlesi strain H]SBO24799.1 KIR protein [Plasmodium knowlesi strain H]SBO28062.1 KIR protein [Plasmodium knowlesi strain H]VVS78429.1 KIR protein [Plasmodium knowlesi strain H]|eukprot:XP_002261303.1 KIR protein [Plasmodium knowlesi strain H]
MVDYDDRQGDPILGSLPSTIAYNKLNNTQNLCNGDSSFTSEVEAALRVHDKDDDYISTLKEKWCYASKDNEGTLSKEHRCGFLYYWFGDSIYSSTSNEGEFWNLMEAVRDELNKLPGISSNCDVVLSRIDRNNFMWEKKVYEFYRDYQTIETNQGGTDLCSTTKLDEYLKAAQTAYNTVSGQCKGEKPPAETDKCNGFMEKYGQNKPQELLDKKCQGSANQRDLGRTVTHTRELKVVNAVPQNEGGPTVAGPIFGTLFTLALPTIGFFLYKYTDLFDGIKNSLFGGSNRNRRRGRSTIRHQHFDDTLTGNDYSTLGDDGSTTLGGGGGSSTDISTIYNDDDGGRRRPSPPRRTRATNNRRSGNIRYYAT